MTNTIEKKPRSGSLVEFYIPNGLRLINGRAVPEQKKVRGRVRIVMPTHLVCTVGKRYGSPYCVESFKLIRQ